MNTYQEWLRTEEAEKLEVTDIPEYTADLEDEQNEIKENILDWEIVEQEDKDRLDYLQFLEGANRFKVSDPARAKKYYQRAYWEENYGSGENFTNIK